MLYNGVMLYIMKSFFDDELLKVLKIVVNGEEYVDINIVIIKFDV